VVFGEKRGEKKGDGCGREKRCDGRELVISCEKERACVKRASLSLSLCDYLLSVSVLTRAQAYKHAHLIRIHTSASRSGPGRFDRDKTRDDEGPSKLALTSPWSSTPFHLKNVPRSHEWYGVPMISRLLKITRLFCRINPFLETLLQNIVSFMVLFCKREVLFSGAYCS